MMMGWIELQIEGKIFNEFRNHINKHGQVSFLEFQRPIILQESPDNSYYNLFLIFLKKGSKYDNSKGNSDIL